MDKEQVYEIKRAYDTGYVKGYKLAEKKYKEVIDKAKEYIETKRIREKAIVDADVLEGILNEVE